MALTFSIPASGQEKEFQANGYIQMQGGVFVPLTSQLFKDYDNTAYRQAKKGDDWIYDLDRPCDPVFSNSSHTCFPKSHGNKAGKLSMMRGTIQLQADWKPQEFVSIHAVLRMVGSLKLDLDKYAQPPKYAEGVDARDYAKNWVWENYYNEVDLREFYVDAEVTDWLSFRLGRQQVSWGDVGSYRLLDVVNPLDNTWHFGPLESFEDTRIPLWMVKALFEMKKIEHSLEIVWVPAIDRDEDMVNVPLTFVGAWGLPLSNTTSPYIIDEKKFLYPGNEIEDQRIGLRWRGNITPASTYTLIYYYTHQLSPPIPLYYDLYEDENGYYDDQHMKTLYLGFPRQHIAGFTIDYAFENPIGMVAKLEMAVEPNRVYPRQSTTRYTEYVEGREDRIRFQQPEFTTLNYAIQLMRPTMIRWLNPTQNILMVLQFSHSIVPGLTEEDKVDVINIPGYNDDKLGAHSFTGVFVMGTQYLHGMLAPRVVVGQMWGCTDQVSGVDACNYHGGFVTGQLDLRFGQHWRLRFQVTDFWADDAYKSIGYFRDRDEINFRIRYQF